MVLAPYIQELLAHRNFVILPGFGAFQPGELLPVQLTENNELLPPKRGVAFNALLSNQDAVLAQFIAEREQRDSQEVLAELQQLVFDWKTRLNKGASVEVEGLGTFVKENTLVRLIPIDELRVDRESFGLPVVERPAVEIDIPVVEEMASTEKEPKQSAKPKPAKAVEKAVVSSSDSWFAAAMIAFVLASASVAYLFMNL
jgi:hypothetical protein